MKTKFKDIEITPLLREMISERMGMRLKELDQMNIGSIVGIDSSKEIPKDLIDNFLFQITESIKDREGVESLLLMMSELFIAQMVSDSILSIQEMSTAKNEASCTIH